MVSWWWLIPAFLLGIIITMLVTIRVHYDYPDYHKLGLSDRDIELSEARLEALWLSKTLQNICSTPDCPDCCTAECWRKDANKWAKKIIGERIRGKIK